MEPDKVMIINWACEIDSLMPQQPKSLCQAISLLVTAALKALAQIQADVDEEGCGAVFGAIISEA